MTSKDGRNFSERKLLIGPINQCGQAFYWTDAVQHWSGIEARSFAPRSTIARRLPGAKAQGPAHVSIPHHRLSPAWWRSRETSRVLKGTTHLMIESFVPIFDPQSGDFKGEIRDLEKENVSVAVICHGSEIRRPDSHLERHKYSYFSEGSPTWVSRLRDLTSRNQALIAETGLPVFVSTPDLLLDVPSARWLPLCVDLEMWRCERPALERTRPVVLHLPSRRNPPIKGTQYIDPVLTDLEARGLIRYLHPESVPHSSMSALVQEADIIVDQILTGSYGVAAIEGMAAGRVVVGSVSPETRNLLPEAPPIVDASPANLRETIESLIEDREMGSTLASSGLRYSERWHNGAASTKALSGYLGGI